MRQAAILGLLLAVTATGTATAGSWWLAAGPAAGGLGLDPHLADYRWDTTVKPAWGLQALAGRERVAFGLRAWRAGTTQDTGLAGVAASAVRLTGVEAAAQARLVSVLGCEVWAAALVGRLHAAYDPGRLSLDVGGGAPIAVAFEPVGTWSLGLGAELRRPVARSLWLGLQVERTGFDLETSHRQGDGIVTGTERFHNWSARLLAAWSWSLS